MQINLFAIFCLIVAIFSTLAGVRSIRRPPPVDLSLLGIGIALLILGPFLFLLALAILLT